jgi:spermidine/putrescine transport system permease protein
MMHSRAISRALFVFAMLYLAFLYIPVLLLPLFSFNDNIYVAFPLKGFTFKWYQSMLANRPLVDAFLASVKVGLLVSAVSTVLGMLAAMAMTRYDFPCKRALTSLIMVPLVIPYIILGVSLLVLARQALGINLSLWTIGLSHILVCVPLAMLVLMARLEGFDKSLEEASFDLGEGAWRTFWRITFPLAVPGIISSFLLCFSTSFDEFVLAFFLSGTEPTLPIYMYSLLRFPSKVPGTLALASCILLGSIVVIVFSEWYRRRGVEAKQGSIV